MDADRVVDITEIREGSDLFRSQGYSYVKVTKDGVARVLKIPIKSSGVTEVIERVRRSEPRPPRAPITITGESEAGRALGMRKGEKRVVTDFDYTAREYLDAKEKYEQELALEIIDAGLAAPIRDASGQVVTERDRKIAILKALGLSLPQFQQMVQDIQNLTTLTEDDRRAFFGVSSESEVTTSSA